MFLLSFHKIFKTKDKSNKTPPSVRLRATKRNAVYLESHRQAMGGLERFAAEGAAGCAVFLVGAAERLGAPDLLSVELYKDLSKAH